MKETVFRLLLFLFMSSCTQTNNKPAGRDGWLKGNENEKFETVATQFRGFDMAMVETGYRYTQLYWAGQDQNWEYAHYQLDKIKTAIESGLVRRPKRGPSSQVFLQNAIPLMKEAINKRDTVEFNRGFQLFQASCNSCHIAEKMPFFKSAIPVNR